MLQIGVRRGVPSLSGVRVHRGAMSICGLDDNCCNDALQAGHAQRLLISTQSSCRASRNDTSNRSVAQRILNVEVEADHHQRYHVWEKPVRCTATAVALQVPARQRGACFEALYQRLNGLTKQHTKQTAANVLQTEKELRELSSLHTKHEDVKSTRNV
eukprot:6172712-Pleurochrysis_carterae.AAC.1